MASSSPCACQFLLLLLNFIVLGVQGQYYQQPPYQQPGYNQYNQQSVCNTQPGYNNQPPMQNYLAQPVGGCPRGWEADGQCTFGNCITPTQLCQKTYNVCCRVSTTQAVQSCQQNPKTSACELTWCPMGAYRDGGCSKMGMCMDPSEKCVNGDCCEKSYLPTGMEPNPCSSSAPINTNPGYGQPMYNPSTYGNQQIIGYTADGRPVYAASPMTNYGAAQPMSYTNPASSAYPYAGSPVAAPIVYYPTYSYSAPYTAPGTQPGYSAPYTAPGTQPGYPSPYTNTGYGNPTSAYDPAALQQACAGGDQSTCATQVQANPSVCQQGGQQIVMSCPRACNLCSGVSYGRKK